MLTKKQVRKLPYFKAVARLFGTRKAIKLLTQVSEDSSTLIFSSAPSSSFKFIETRQGAGFWWDITNKITNKGYL